MAHLTWDGPNQLIKDSNGNEVTEFEEVASAVNHPYLKNAATGNGAEIGAVGGDTNIDLNLAPKGSGSVSIPKGIKAVDAYTDVTKADAHPKWFKYTVTHTALQAAATSNDIELLSLPAGGVIHAVKTKHSVAFSGGAIATYTVSVGIAGTLAKYSSAFNVFQAIGNTVFQMSSTLGSENHGAVTSIRVAAVSSGANLNASAAGSVDIWVLISKPV
jgi:hypothetical protein